MNMTEITLHSECKYDGKIVRLRVDRVKLPNGRETAREVVEHPGGVCVAALTSKDELLFVRQFRYPYKELLLELPAGKLERGEDPDEAVKRELMEETGAEGGKFHFLGKQYPSPGYCGEILWLYATRVESIGRARPDEDEFLEAERIPLSDAVDMVLRGELPDGKTQTAVLTTERMVRDGRL